MMIFQQKKVQLVNNKTSIGNPDYISGIYLTTAKVAQLRLVADNRRKKKRVKKEKIKEDSHPNVASSTRTI